MVMRGRVPLAPVSGVSWQGLGEKEAPLEAGEVLYRGSFYKKHNYAAHAGPDQISMHHMQANERRDAIEEILTDQDVQSQGQLAELLSAQGIDTTQPMLSRDLRSLKVAKRDGIYQLFSPERVTPLENLASLLRSATLAGPNLCVVLCEPGAASAVARALEAEGIRGVFGTVAGDDSIFVAVESKVAGGQIVDLVEQTIGEEL